MSFNTINKEDLDSYLKELGKTFRKLTRKSAEAELILIGGAAVLTNYKFREVTQDVDAVILACSSMKDAINMVGDKFNLPANWLNDDFLHTTSYSPKLSSFCKYYKTFANVLHVRTVSAEYLIAMKLCAGRDFKNDLSDIVGILAEHKKNGFPITFKNIDIAVKNLYGDWSRISEESKAFIEDVMSSGEFDQVYADVRREEIIAKSLLLDFQDEYPGVVNESNVREILSGLKAKKKPSLIETVETCKPQQSQTHNSSNELKFASALKYRSKE